MPVHAYLVFNGNCREAVEFYKDAFQTEASQMMTFGESPQSPEFPLPEDAKELIMHARLNVSGSEIMFSDNFPGTPYTVGNNITLAVIMNKQEEITAAYEKLKQGGRVGMELQETFWSKWYGTVTDQFGVHWQLSLLS
ncbi:VOC family protein [Alkalihalobacillus sp. LMS39]|uniref:VOC family protein n=1 Tax=Alkalihalobacillus sp. LMS39 TaxID=2924032 RepID=UPI001FB54CC1|nr:VOC family protein [Alkalihalobacillus sp. LMS39]UOE95807.1 VOC family protein [Alkalihalobacillus sp. LMS39]